MNANLVVLKRSAHQSPKKRFAPATVTLDGVETPVQVTGKIGGKWPQYTFLFVDGVNYYLPGDLRGQTLVTKEVTPEEK